MEKCKFISIIEKHKTMISIILGLFIALGLKLEYIQEGNLLRYTARANDMIYLLFTIGIVVFINHTAETKGKRLWKIAIFVGLIFAICYYLGDIQNHYIYTYVPTSKKFILYSLIKLVIYFIIFTNCVVMLFYKLPVIAKKFDSKKELLIFTNNKKSFWIVTAIFCLSYLPFFLYYFPGNINTDNIGSLYQIIGLKPYSNLQPLIYTFIFGGTWNLGKAIFGTSTAGIALYTIIQMICTSLVFSTILYYMAKRRVSLKWRIITFLFLLLNPLNGWFAIRGEKGMLFHLSLILVIIGLIDIIHERENFFGKLWKPLLLGIITIFMVLIRNNGIYALLLALPFLLVACRKIRKKVVILFGVTFAIVFTIQGPIFKVAKVGYSSPGEVLTIPMQQFARITKYASDRLSDEDREVIQKYFPVDSQELADDYVPWKSDSTKAHFEQERFIEDKKTFIMQYFKFALKFPVQTVSSVVMNTGINYSPNFNVWGLIRNYGTETEDAYETAEARDNNFMTDYPIDKKVIVNFGFLNTINEELIKGNIPVISNLFDNIGFYFWILILCFNYCIYKKQYKNMIMMLPILGLWITTIAAPMVDLRYIYPMFLTTPLFIGIIMKDGKIEEN